MCYTKFCFIRRLNVWVLLSKVFLILKQESVTCQTKYFMDKMNYVSRCELVYSQEFDILRNNYYVSLTTSRFRGLHSISNAVISPFSKENLCHHTKILPDLEGFDFFTKVGINVCITTNNE